MNPVQRISPANGRLGQTMQSVQRAVRDVPHQMAECVDERPVAALCAAFGAGLVTGVGLVALYYQAQHQQATTYETLMQRASEAFRNAIPQQLSAFRA